MYPNKRSFVLYLITESLSYWVINFHIRRGLWGETKYCAQNMAICGIKVRMADSDTALNGAMFQCCDLPNNTNHLLEPKTKKSNIFADDISEPYGRY